MAALSSVVIAGCGTTAVDDGPVSVIPAPSHIEMREGAFTIKPATKIVIGENEAEIARTAGFLNERLRKAAGFELEVTSEPADGGIFFMEAGLSHESYSIHCSPERIVIEYGDGAGAFYGLQTLLQLLPVDIFSESRVRRDWTVPACLIEDSPRFAWRGMHIDCSLHFFDMDFLKRYIDLMAMHKVNRFHWHLTDDQGWRIEIKKYPLLTEKGQWRKETVIGSLYSGIYDGKPYGGYYSQEDVRELVQYAAERYVTIIPEIEMPGHSLAAIACYPELSCGLEDSYEVGTRWGVFRQVYCPKEETFAFLEDVLDEVMELFPSEVIHIGGDECPKKSWKQCSHCQSLIKKLGLKDEFALQSWFITRIGNYVTSKGRTIIGWDEIIQGGLAPDARVMSWLGEEGGITAARQHHEAVMAPYQKYYLDYAQGDTDSEPLSMGGPTMLRTMYDYEPVPSVLTPEEQRYIIGVEGCVWTEYLPTPERVEYMAWPRMCAIAESGWTPAGRKDWRGFTERLEKHLGRFDRLGVGYCTQFFRPMIELHDDTEYDKVVVMGADAPDVEIRYTLDGSVPGVDSPLYEEPFPVNRSQVVSAALFRNGARIGDVRTKSWK